MNRLEVLRAARERIAKPGAWCQGGLAFSRGYAFEVNPDDRQACMWCARGAISVAAGDDFGVAEAAEVALMPHAPDPGQAVERFNDNPTRTQAEVVYLFTAAIERLESEAAQ